MPTDRRNDLQAFCEFARAQLANGRADLTLDEALVLWDCDNQTPEEREDTLQAIRRGLEDMKAGRTVDAFEFVARMRQKLQVHDAR
jgi:hypothetical protein